MTLYYWESPNNKIHLLRIMKENMVRHGEIYDINCKIEKTEKEKILLDDQVPLTSALGFGASI